MVEKKAVCVLEGQVQGTLHFLQKGDGPTKITGNLSGVFPPGLHGFHVHQYGDYSGGCASTGGHYNPHGLTHGGPTDAERHAGDLGNIQSDVNGNVAVDISDSQIPLSGVHSIIGRAIVVHAGTDDLGRGGHDDSKTTGHAGGRIGCGVIGFGK